MSDAYVPSEEVRSAIEKSMAVSQKAIDAGMAIYPSRNGYYLKHSEMGEDFGEFKTVEDMDIFIDGFSWGNKLTLTKVKEVLG